jgi:hypothetical protein
MQTIENLSLWSDRLSGTDDNEQPPEEPDVKALNDPTATSKVFLTRWIEKYPYTRVAK